jgi:hypothetical protein
MFYPVLLFLDDQHKPVSVVRNLPFQFDGRWSERRYGMSAKLQMNDAARQSKYLVVYTEPDFLSRAFKFSARGTSGVGVIVPRSSSDTSAIPFNYEGRVGLNVYYSTPSP